MKKDDNQQNDNREFFRVDDDLCFDYFVVPSTSSADQVSMEEIQERLFSEEEYRQFNLIRQLYEIDAESNRYLAEIARVQPEVSRYLESMHQKFNLLTQSLSEKHANNPKQLNLSIGGVAFQAENDLPENTLLKVKVMFYPSGLGIIATLKVLRCSHLPTKDKTRPYQICGRFIDLSPMDEQIIHQHILQKQILDSY